MKILLNTLFSIFLIAGIIILLIAIEEATKFFGRCGDLWMAWGCGLIAISIAIKILSKRILTSKSGWSLIISIIFTTCALIDLYYLNAYVLKGENNLLNQILLFIFLWLIAGGSFYLFHKSNRKKSIY